MPLFRKILFYSFVLIYVIGCPVIIFNSLGILFLPKQEKLIQSTGLISLATIPDGASVLINGRLDREKTPLIVRDLPEGEYRIRITLDKYVPWEKTVHVAKKEATTLEHIILIPEEWPRDTLSPVKWERSYTVDDNPYIILEKGLTGRDISFFRTEGSILSGLKDGISASKRKGVEPLFPQDSKYNSLRISSILMMPKSHFALLEGKSDVKKYYLWVDLRSPMDSIRDISDLFVSAPDSILWHSEDSENIFYVSSNGVTRINIEENAVYPNIANNVKSLGAFNRRLYVVDNANQFQEFNYMNNAKRTLIGHWLEMPVFFKESTGLGMEILSEDLILFIGDGGRLLSTRLPYELIPSGVAGVGGALGNTKILIWTKARLGFIDFGEVRHEGVFEAGPKITWVAENAEGIQQAFWVNNGSHILFRDLAEMKLAEVDSYAPASIFEVGKVNGEISYSDPLGKVFFIDKDTGKLMSLTVVPEHQMIQFELPDMDKEKKD